MTALRLRRELVLTLLVPAGALWLLLTPGGPGAYAHATVYGAVPPLAAYCAAWTLMVVAMMWPSARAFLRATRVVGGERGMTAAVTTYTAAWTGVGVVAWLALATTATWRASLSPEQAARMASLVLIVAAIYELSPWSRSCQRWCARPMTILARWWTRGRAPIRNGMAAGAVYGATCVGCCVAMLAVSTVVGVSSATWMLALTAIMAAQKSLRIGEWLHWPVALGLVVLAIAQLSGWEPSSRHMH